MKRHSKRTSNDDADVPGYEENKEGAAKFSIDYFKLLNSEDTSLPYSIVMVNHEDGGVFSYATPKQGNPRRSILGAQTFGERHR